MDESKIDRLISLIEMKEFQRHPEQMFDESYKRKDNIFTLINSYSGIVIMLGGVILSMISGYWYLKDNIFSLVNKQDIIMTRINEVTTKISGVEKDVKLLQNDYLDLFYKLKNSKIGDSINDK